MSNDPTETRSNALRIAWRDGRETVGAFCRIPGTYIPEIFAHVGYDYVVVDTQHGPIDLGNAVTMVQAVDSNGVASLVRIPENNPARIGQLLDAGASGIVVPMVNTADEARRVVAATRYQPEGSRSYGPFRATGRYGVRSREELEDVAVVIMIETLDGLANAQEIAAVPGVDCLYVGPADLACAMGLWPGQHDVVEKGIRTIREAARNAGIVAGIQCQDGAAGRRRLDEGFRMVTVAQDVVLLNRRAAEQLSVALPGDAP